MKSDFMGKGLLLSAFFLVLALPAVSAAADLSFTSETRLRLFEQDTFEEDDALVFPAYEYLRLDASGDDRVEGLSFHLFGWGRMNFGDDGIFEDDTAGELLYGYLQYDHPDTSLGARLGRFYVFEGVANEAVDGLRLSAGVTPYFTLSAYGGQPVGLDSTDGRDGDSIWGGRIAHRLGPWYEVGASYKLVKNDSGEEENFAGLDLYAALPADLSLSGYSTLNLETDDWAEHSYRLGFDVTEYRLGVFFEHYRYEDYFGTGDNSDRPFTILRRTGEELTLLGADVVRLLEENLEAGLKMKFYDYDQDDSSQYFSALLNWFAEEDLTSAGGELGYMQGDAGGNDYLLARAWFYLDQWEPLAGGFITGDMVYVYYDEDIFNEDVSLFLSLGAGKRVLDEALELKISGDYSTDPYNDHDLRGMLVATYVYDR